MASISYDEIFDSFLGEITDYDLQSLVESDADEEMTEYLTKALHNMYIYNLFETAFLDNDIHVLTYEMDFAWNDIADQGFVINLLGKAMVYEWISPRVNNTANLMQFFGGAEQKFYAQSTHLAQLRELRQQIGTEIRALIENRGLLKNEYLEG